ncbi:MAG TPA: sugar dehydratase [Elusimicrobia bacterium]|nr:sugar dehydratase [Elusimicrobiota bacterium]
MSIVWEHERCLVTGGAGFGGGHLCLRLLSLGARVCVLDLDFPASGVLRLSGSEARVKAARGDARDLDSVRRIIDEQGIGTVFHLAAQPLVTLSNELPFETLHNNALGTYAVLEAARTARKPPRVVFASSGAYYGTTTSQDPIAEDAAPLPAANIYAPSKVAGDAAARSYAKTFGLRTVVCRFMNTYGPGDSNFSRIVPRTARLLLTGASYDFGGRDDGTTVLEYLHVRDMAQAYLSAAAHADEEPGEAFNFGGGRPLSTRELARLASRVFDGKDREPVFSGPRREVPLSKLLDTRKAASRLGWKPEIPLEKGLEETFAWYREHLGKYPDSPR